MSKPGSTYNQARYLANREEWIARSKKTREDNPDGYRNALLKRTYGITLVDYNRMLAGQNGTCAICQGPPNGRGARGGIFYVDHDHETSVVRGLLCHHCNTMLGCAKDSLAMLDRAGVYLKNHGKTE